MKQNYGKEFQTVLKLVGKYFKLLRNKKNEKLYSVSNSIGVTHPVISQIENGKYYSLNFKIITNLLEYYNVRLEELIIYILMNLNGIDSYHVLINQRDDKNGVLQLHDVSSLLDSHS